jgi:hypothetical protein
MLQFLASISAVLWASPKARAALRNLAVRGTVLTMDVKEQIEQAIGLNRSEGSESSHTQAPLEETVGHPSYSSFTHSEPSSPDTEPLPDFKHTYGVLSDEAIKQHLPKP